MRIFHLLFSFYLLFLAFEPGLSTIGLPEEEVGCCSNTACTPVESEPREEEKKEPMGGCGETGNCNPFQTCSNCTAVTSAAAALNPLLPLTISNTKAIHPDETPTTIALDFWQPPKIG